MSLTRTEYDRGMNTFSPEGRLFQVEYAIEAIKNHRFSYGEPMTVESTTQAICDLALRFGEGDEESMSRPFGVSLLIAGHDENGPSLYYTDPSGTFWQCNAKAIGSGSEGADSSLQEQYNKEGPSMSLGLEKNRVAFWLLLLLRFAATIFIPLIVASPPLPHRITSCQSCPDQAGGCGGGQRAISGIRKNNVRDAEERRGGDEAVESHCPLR